MRTRARDQSLADARASRQNLHQPRRKRGEHLHELERRKARLLVGLDDNRVAGSKRGGCLPAQEHQRIVEGEDDDDCAERFLDAEMELPGNRGTSETPGFVTCQLGVVVDRRGAPGHLVDGFLIGLALLAREALRVWRLVPPQERCDVVKDNRTAAGIHSHPHTSRGIGKLDRVVHLAIGRVGDAAGALLRCGIDHVEELGRATRLETTVNVNLSREPREVLQSRHDRPPAYVTARGCRRSFDAITLSSDTCVQARTRSDFGSYQDPS